MAFSVKVRPRVVYSSVEEGIVLVTLGLSAYEVWLKEGNEGTVHDFLEDIKGLKGDTGDTGPMWTILSGNKSSAVDAGEIGQVSLGDDYVYFCVQTGTTGNAIWKKAVLFQT